MYDHDRDLNMKKCAAFICLVFAFYQSGSAQGFMNLDFESSIPTNTFVLGNGEEAGFAIIPGWVPYINGTQQSSFRFNVISSNGGAVLIGGPSVGAIQGNYEIGVFGGDANQNTATIGQTGTIPLTAQSLTFWGNVDANDVAFDGQTLALTVLESNQNYNVYGADISGFAGQTGELLFTAAPGSNDTIDNIQFNSSPVPEPRCVALAALGAIFLGVRFVHRANSCQQA